MIEIRFIYNNCLTSKVVSKDILVYEINNLLKNDLKIVKLIEREAYLWIE